MKYLLKFALLFIFFLPFSTVHAQFHSSWKKGNIGTWAGMGGMAVLDFDEDGKDEVVTRAVLPNSYLANFWFTMDQLEDGLSLEQDWFSYLNLWSWRGMDVVKQPDGSGYYYVQVSELEYVPDLARLLLQVYDLESKALILEWNFPKPAFHWELADYTGDGKKELLILTKQDIQVWDFPKMELLKTIHAGPGYAKYFKIGNFDKDPELEFFMTYHEGFNIFNVQQDTLRPLWDQVRYCICSDFSFHDLDEDGDLEIFAISESEHIFAYEPERREELWSYTFNQHGVDRFTFFDWDGNGTTEIIYSGFHSIGILHLTYGRKIYSIPKDYGFSSLEYTSDLYTGDVNGDGIPELIWTDGRNRNVPPPSRFYVQELRHPFRWWVSNKTDMDLNNFDCLDFLGNGRKQLLHANPTFSPDRLDAGSITLYDAETKEVLHRSEPESEGTNGPFLHTFQGLQLDDDPPLEIISAVPDGYLHQFNLPEFELEWYRPYTFPASTRFKAFEQVDLDGDGRREIVSCLETVAAAGEGASYVVVYDSLMNLLWHTPHVEQNPYINNFYLRTGNIDDDPQKEIVVIKTNAYWQYYAVQVVDGLTRATYEFSNGEKPLFSLELYDMDGDGKDEVLLGRTDEIEIWDGETMTLQRTIALPEDDPGFFPNIENLKTFDVDQDGTPELVLTHQGKVKLMDPFSGEIYWQSHFLGIRPSPLNKLVVTTVADTPRIYVGTQYFIEEFTWTGSAPAAPFPEWTPPPRLSVHPNPTNGPVRMESASPPHQITISTLDGKIVRSWMPGQFTEWQGGIELTLTGLPGGMYFLHAYGPEGVRTAKVILENQGE